MSASVKEVENIHDPVRLAPRKLDSLNLVAAKSEFSSCALTKVALLRFVFCKFALLKFAPVKFASDKSTEVKSAYSRST